jgi:integrase/recombinase XerD
MPVKLSTTIKKIENIPNLTNRYLLIEFHKYLDSNGVSESHQNNNLKALTAFAHFLGSITSFLDIKENDLVRSFLDSKLKSREDDPDRKSIVTWNDFSRSIGMSLAK